MSVINCTTQIYQHTNTTSHTPRIPCTTLPLTILLESRNKNCSSTRSSTDKENAKEISAEDLENEEVLQKVAEILKKQNGRVLPQRKPIRNSQQCPYMHYGNMQKKKLHLLGGVSTFVNNFIYEFTFPLSLLLSSHTINRAAICCSIASGVLAPLVIKVVGHPLHKVGNQTFFFDLPPPELKQNLKENHISLTDEFHSTIMNLVYFGIGMFVSSYFAEALWVYTSEKI
jgi:hypothetical protein